MSYIILIFVATLICSCSDTTQITNSEQVYIKDFRKKSKLYGEKLNYIQNIGFYGCEIIYPYLILNLYKQENHIAVYNLKKELYYGDYFKGGVGPNEYLDFTILNQYRDSIIWINDVHRKKIKSYILNQTNDSLVFNLETEYDYANNNEDVFSVFVCPDSTIWEKQYDIEKKLLYYTNSSRKKTIYPFHDNISRNDLNRIMTLADGIKEDGTKIVSLTGIWDQIEIINLLRNGKSLSVTTSTNVLSWEIYKKTSSDQLQEYYLSLPRCNNEYIMTLHNNNGKKELILIDWEGHGIAIYFIEEDLIDFAIDWKENIIYGVTANEEVYKYLLDDKL